MSVSITHAFVSGKAAGSDSTRVYGTHWDADHVVPVATTAEAQAASSDTVLMTPAKTLDCINANVPSGSALTKVDDTNITLTLGGTPTTALLRATSLTLGWTGTLAASRLNSNVVQGVTNDTNVTGSISAQNLTLGWTGTLAVARGGTGVGSASGTALDNISGFASTGIIARTAAGTYTFLTVTGTANEITVTNGNGVSGNTTLSLPAALTFTGKTVTGGTFATITVSGTWAASGTWTIPAVTLGGAVTGNSQNISGLGTIGSGAVTVTATSASSLAVGRQGATDPVLKVDASTASVATGISITGAAAAGGVALAAISSGANENLKIDAKGSGTITLGGTSTGGVTIARALSLTVGTASTSTSTGSLIVTGGVGLSGALNVGSTIDAASNIRSNMSTGTAAFVTAINGSSVFRGMGADENNTVIDLVSFGSTSIGPTVVGRRARGTIASPAVPQNDDRLNAMLGGGYDGSSWLAGQCGFVMKAAETWSTTALGTKITFETTATGSTSRLVRWTVAASGGMWSLNATGGDKGIDTINAGAVYDDNTLLTCFGVEYIKHGKVNLEFWDAVSPKGEHPLAREFLGLTEIFNPRSRHDYIRYMMDTESLPGMPSKSDWRHNEIPISGIANRLWLAGELQAGAVVDISNDLDQSISDIELLRGRVERIESMLVQ